MHKKEIMAGTWIAISLMLAAAVGTTIVLEKMATPFTPQVERSASDWWMK